jgi:hypothetical protein
MNRRRYLEISSLGSACGKMSFEPRERTLLYTWARCCPKDCKEFLISEKIILKDNDADELFEFHDNILKKNAKHVSFLNTNTSDFKNIVSSSKEELKSIREKEGKKVTKEELNELESNANKYIKTTYGNNSEDPIIKKVAADKGNNKMWYFNLNEKWCIGGKHDATKDEYVYEIKTRTSEKNVRKNVYDLYQLYGYLLAMGKTRGKIIQQFNGKIYDSDFETENEWGCINSNFDGEKINTMLIELEFFFERLDEIINNKCMTPEEIKIAIPSNDKPICKLKNNEYINKLSKYSKLFLHI